MANSATPATVSDAAAPPPPAATAAVTNAVVAILVSLSPGEGVGAFGSPVNVGLASGALPEISPCTKAVVAICVVFVAAAAVGAVGVPVNAGDANGAFAAKSLTRLVTSLSA